MNLLHTVLICDTEPIAIEGLRSLLASAGGLRVIAAEISLVDSIDAAREMRPDLVVIDKALGMNAVLDWLHAIRRAAQPPAAIVWGATLCESEALRVLHVGVAGLVRKTSSLESLLQCLRSVAEGGTWMEDDLLRDACLETHAARSPLTARETDVIELVQQGMKNREIALALGISVGTVKIHLKHVFEKTGIHGRYGLALSSLKRRMALPAAVV